MYIPFDPEVPRINLAEYQDASETKVRHLAAVAVTAVTLLEQALLHNCFDKRPKMKESIEGHLKRIRDSGFYREKYKAV